MNTQTLEKRFSEIGARVKVSPPSNRWNSRDFVIDVRRDKEGEYFDIQAKDGIDMIPLDVQKNDRHLLLMARLPEAPKAKFLCGHDERHWFTCAVPATSGIPVSTVFQAKQALKPADLRELESREGLKTSRTHKRHRKLNSGKKVHRQGEFMFIPVPDFQPPKGFNALISKNEPMRGGGTHMHWAEYLYRSGGETVYVHRIHAPNGFTKKQYDEFISKHSNTFGNVSGWRTMTRNATVYVKGRISHEEHSTVDLGDVWHRVVVNTESNASYGRAVAFLD